MQRKRTLEYFWNIFVKKSQPAKNLVTLKKVDAKLYHKNCGKKLTPKMVTLRLHC
jgi:hypothetical protein